MDNPVIPFPQANDFDKVVALVNIGSEDDLKNNDTISIVLGELSNRQVDYYIAAAAFLGFIDPKTKEFTELGKRIRGTNSVLQEVEFITALLQAPVFGKVFALEKVVGRQNITDAALIIKESYPMYCDAICERRAQTVLKWVGWALSKMN